MNPEQQIPAGSFDAMTKIYSGISTHIDTISDLCELVRTKGLELETGGETNFMVDGAYALAMLGLSETDRLNAFRYFCGTDPANAHKRRHHFHHVISKLRASGQHLSKTAATQEYGEKIFKLGTDIRDMLDWLMTQI